MSSYRIYSINRPGRLLNFWTLRMGAYSRWAIIRGWALIRINTVFPFSESELSHTSCKLQAYLRLFRLFRGDSSGMDRSSSAKCLLYSDVMKGEPSPTGRGRRSRDEKGNQGVGDIRFTNILQLFSIYFFFSITLLYHFFSILFLPTTFTHTHTHGPRPTTFSYTPNWRY